jgi:hypothetical protein
MATWLVVLLPTLPSGLAAVLVWQVSTANRRQTAEQAARTIALDERKADREELQTALAFWRTSFEAVSLDNKELRKELDVERRDHRRTKLRVDKLEREIRQAGLEVPNNGSEGSP